MVPGFANSKLPDRIQHLISDGTTGVLKAGIPEQKRYGNVVSSDRADLRRVVHESATGMTDASVPGVLRVLVAGGERGGPVRHEGPGEEGADRVRAPRSRNRILIVLEGVLDTC